MRLRFWLYLVFGTIAILPLALIGAWSSNYISSNEIERAKTQQMLQAESASRAANRLVSQLTGEFREKFILHMQARGSFEKSAERGFGDVLIYNLTTGTLTAESSELSRLISGDDAYLKTAQSLSELASDSQANITPIMVDKNGNRKSYLVAKHANYVAFANLNGDALLEQVLTKLGKANQIYALVDENGYVLAKQGPKDWNLSLSDAVLPQDTHEEQYTGNDAVDTARTDFNKTSFSTLIGASKKLLAGVAPIPYSKLRILSGEPYANVLRRTGGVKRRVTTIIYSSLALVLLFSILGSYVLASPIEKMIKNLRRANSAGNLQPLEVDEGAMTPLEHHELTQSYNDMVGRLHDSNSRILCMAYEDQVTNLPNRAALRLAVEGQLVQLAKSEKPAAIVFIDISNFKDINDAHGHTTGDQVLRIVAARMNGIIEAMTGISPILDHSEDGFDYADKKPQPILARFGSAEFALFVPGDEELKFVEEMVKQMLAAIACPISGIEIFAKLKGAAGIARFPDQGLTFDDLVKRADIAMYHAKKNTGNSIEFYSSKTGDKTGAEIRHEVSQAIKAGDMALYYQPKICTKTKEITSAEALVRWHHPERGTIGPGGFIPAVEDSDDASVEMGEFVVRQTCRDYHRLVQTRPDLKLSVNISARHFSAPNFQEKLIEICAEEKCPAQKIEVEITEEAALSSNENAAAIIKKLQEVGFSVSLDDYGRGYSNLSRLADLKVDAIKIDGPLTARLTHDDRTRVILEATVNMAEGLGCRTVAEGVETAQEVAVLTTLGCNELQGFFYSQPLPLEKLVEWISARHGGVQANPLAELQEELERKLSVAS